MSTQKARTVTAHINDKGTVEEVNDPFYDHFWDPDTRLDRALAEEHYGWTLKPMVDKPIPVNPVFPGEVDICTNDPDDTTHLNTLATQKPQVVKLDVGYWGTYNREHEFQTNPKHGPPQRNFGMIQGRDVWLCNYSGIDAASGNTDEPAADSAAGKLLTYLRSKGLDVEILSYALAPCTAFTADTDPDTLYILFSDLHLPERFPDAPDENKRQRLPDGDLRLPLRKELRNCQHEFGFLAGNSDMDEKRAAKIQDYLEGHADNANDQFFVKETHTFSADKTYTYFRDNVLAEKYILDRTIRTRSCWYYGPAKGNSEDGDHEAKPDFAEMNAGPSVDLATFLAAVLVTRNAGANIKVIQLGDLYELWMGREFLYRDFPVTTTFDTLSIPNFALIALQRKFHFMGGEDDDYQYRFDEEWSDGTVQHAIKRYPFHQFPRSEMIKRHKTGWDYFKNGAIDQDALLADNVTPEIVDRVKARLGERGANVEDFSLPLPCDDGDSTRVDKLNAVLKEASGQKPDDPDDGGGQFSLQNYQQTNADPLGVAPLPANEYRWHRLVFDLFLALDFRNIHGNHDGYRSDPLISDAVSITAEEWISLPGIWIEHGHRWDEFNRDGCAIGAGMTNMVYYHNLSMLDSDRGSTIKDCFMNQDEKCFLPGAAQWFLLANMTDNVFKSRDGSQTVLPFGIVVVGHTHHPDLCYIDYEKQGAWDSFVEVAEKIGKDIADGVEAVGKAATFVADKAKDAAGAVADKAKDAAGAVGAGINKVGDAVTGAAGAAADKIKSLF